MIKRSLLLTLLLVLLSSGALASGPLAFKDLMEVYPDVEDHYSWSSYQRGYYLIIGADAALLSPFLDFFRVSKEKQGFRVHIAGLSETGNTTTSIRDYIADFYASHDLEYVLLIGDVDGNFALPAFTYGPENDVTDLPYVLIEGGGDDYFPEAFIGRWPVDTLQELAVVILKTLNYSETPDTESGYLDRALVAAGNYADSGTILTPVWTSLWLRDELDDHGYASVDTVFFPPVTGPEQILSAWNNGVGIVNYRGWGDAHGWHFPHFHVSDFSGGNLSNGNKLPIVFSFVCGTGKFDSSIDPSFCEAMLTAGTLTVPSGAVAVVAPSDLHTRTKFNNALNSKLWDALMEGHVNELAPALLASKFGFLDEFVNELGPGEMAEFYYHTYNVIGDPSLPIWLLTPEEIDVTVEDFGTVTWDDGLIAMNRPDLPEGVFALRQNNAIIGSGRWTNGEIRIHRYDGAAFHDPENPDEALEITLNVPQHLPITLDLMPEAGSGLAFAGMQEAVHSGLETWTPQVHNYSAAPVFVTLQLSSEDGSYDIAAGSNVVPAGATLAFSTITCPSIGITERELVLNATINSTTSAVAIPLSPVVPEFEVNFSGSQRPLPNDNFSLQLSGGFFGLDALGNTVTVTLTSESDFASITDASGTATVDADGYLVFSDANFSGSIGNVSHGSRLHLDFTFVFSGQGSEFYGFERSVVVGTVETHDPTPPRQGGGYWAYDDTDTEYPEVPTYDWLDLSTEAGAVHHLLADDDHTVVTLPFSFKYYDQDYDVLTINSNGWASFGPDYINYFRNWSIPMPLGPDAMLAPFWDDLDNDTLVNGQEQSLPIDVYTYHDEGQGKYFIEWHEVYNGFGDRTYQETFQIVLYDPAMLAADDGNGVIEFQYAEVYDVDQINNYSTVGVESPDQNDGLMYVYALNYAPGAASLEHGRIIRFTTNTPPNYVEVDDEFTLPTSFQLGHAYPNPFNGAATIPYHLSERGEVDLKLYDLRGRLIQSISLGERQAGKYRYTLNADALSSGVYLVHMTLNGHSQVQKVTLLK